MLPGSTIQLTLPIFEIESHRRSGRLQARDSTNFVYLDPDALSFLVFVIAAVLNAFNKSSAGITNICNTVNPLIPSQINP